MSKKKFLSAGSGSIKRVMIDKANARLVVYVSVAVFSLVFSLVASKTLWNQATYNIKVLSEKNKALSNQRQNLQTLKDLSPAYQSFVSTLNNAIGGSSVGIGPQDGDNAKLVLDALPDVYDYPGLATNIETLVNDQQVSLSSILGADDEIAQSANIGNNSPTPTEMPFEISANTDYQKIQSVINATERSIRPIKIQKLKIDGSNEQLSVTINAVTYYQQARTIDPIKMEVVK